MIKFTALSTGITFRFAVHQQTPPSSYVPILVPGRLPQQIVVRVNNHLKTESQRLEDFELRVNVKSSKFTFSTKYARFEHNYSYNVVAIYVLINNDFALNSSSISQHQLLPYLVPKVLAVNKKWNDKAKLISTPFSCWNQLLYIYTQQAVSERISVNRFIYCPYRIFVGTKYKTTSFCFLLLYQAKCRT